MVYKVIKISEKNYRRLLEIAAVLERKRGRRVSFDETIDELSYKEKKKQDIMKFAGAWKRLSDKDISDMKKSINDMRKKETKRLFEEYGNDMS